MIWNPSTGRNMATHLTQIDGETGMTISIDGNCVLAGGDRQKRIAGCKSALDIT